jgi:polysaccharide export outer membrane protein
VGFIFSGVGPLRCVIYLLFSVPLIFSFSGCFWAPGMVFDQYSNEDGSVDTLATFKGAQVHLQSITPKTLTTIEDRQSKVAFIPQKLLDYKPTAYKLGSFDIVQVTVWEHPELTMPLGPYRSDNAVGQLVGDDGSMFYPYAGQIPVAGKTVAELRLSILESLSKILNNPQIDVRLIKSQSQKTYVQGSVQRAGVVPLSDVPISLLDAINQCGGVDELGDMSRVELTRDGETFQINLLATYPAQAGPSDILLKNNDVIRVASLDEAKIYVMGEVTKQQALPLIKGKMTLSQALAEVGGLQVNSAESKGIYVIRMDVSPDTIQVFHLDSRNPLALVFGDQFQLKPNDIVFVDATGLARWNRVVSQILPTAQLLYYSTLVVHNTKTAKDDIGNW